jgi:hypothetical protein
MKLSRLVLFAFLLVFPLVISLACSTGGAGHEDGGTGTDTDTDADTDSDTATHLDGGSDLETDTDCDTDSSTHPPMTECDGGLFDPDTNLCWQHPAEADLDWVIYDWEWVEYPAMEYCINLDHGGSTDWYLPNIDQLRSLIRGCPQTEPGGECEVSYSWGCLSEECAEECGGCGSTESCYWDPALGDDCDIYWSSTQCTGSYADHAWVVYFGSGTVDFAGIEGHEPVRCVRNAP